MDLKEQIQYSLKEMIRIRSLTRKPKKTEYTDVAKITCLGIILVGFIGFVVLIISLIIQRGGL